MGASLEELERAYRAALKRLGEAQDALTETAPEPLSADADPPEISRARRAAENEAREAWDLYVTVRDRYWATRRGTEGDPHKA